MSDLRRVVRDVPESKLNFIVAALEIDGAKVTKTKQDNGLWTVIGDFPDPADLASAGFTSIDAEVEAPSVSPPPLGANRSRDVDVLARTIWGEARGGSLAGMEAVAAVVLNRLRRNSPMRFGATIAEVCLKGQQFSCWNMGDPNRDKLIRVDETNPQFLVCLEIAARAARGDLADPTDGSDHYHLVGVAPTWSRGKSPAKRIDDHIFFNNIA